MVFGSRHSRSILLGLLMFGMVTGVGAADVKTLVQQAKAALRAAENASDIKVKNARLDEARDFIAQIKAADPTNSELRTLESKYRYLDTDRKPAGTAAAASPAASTSAAASADAGKVKQVLDDWNAIIKLDADLGAKTGRFFPNAENIAYTKEQTDQVLALVDDVLKNDKPRVLAFLKTFSGKYGEPNDEMDRKIVALTPKDPKKGMYDEENKRPDELPSQAYRKLLDRLSWIQASPAREAKIILKTVMETVAGADFFQDTIRDSKYAEAEAELARAKRFNPKDIEIAQAMASVQSGRKKSQADVKNALESARFPTSVTSFAGPGTIPNLVVAVKTYYASAYPNEKLLAVSVSGAWVVTKLNILDQPIQWGLPVFCAAAQDEPGVCRVFKMTVLTGIGAGIAKAPPFTDHWTGDSYRMLTANLK
jgi:hypothetical protein